MTPVIVGIEPGGACRASGLEPFPHRDQRGAVERLLARVGEEIDHVARAHLAPCSRFALAPERLGEIARLARERRAIGDRAAGFEACTRRIAARKRRDRRQNSIEFQPAQGMIVHDALDGPRAGDR